MQGQENSQTIQELPETVYPTTFVYDLSETIRKYAVGDKESIRYSKFANMKEVAEYIKRNPGCILEVLS